MKGYRILLLLCCIEMMGAVSSEDHNTHENSRIGKEHGSGNVSDVKTTTQEDNSTGTSTVPISKLATSEASSLWKADSSTTRSPFTISHSAPTSSRAQPFPNTADCMFDRKTGVILLMVTGGLIILCTILLVSTLVLAWKVCQLNRHFHNDTDLISNSEYWIGTAKSNRKKPEAEAKETSILMSHLTQKPEETSTSPADAEEGKVNKYAGTEKEGDTPSIDQASANGIGKEIAGSASSLFPKPPIDITDSPSTKAIAASSSEGSEEPKDVV